MISRMDIPPTRRVAIDAPVTGLAFGRDGKTLGIAGGDGRVHVVPTDTLERPGTPEPAHGGAALALSADPAGDGFVTGGDDGRLLRHAGDGSASEIDTIKGRWLDRLAGHGKTGALAVAAGKDVIVHGANGSRRVLEAHPSTVADLDFNPDGSRLVVAHYGGVTLHELKPAATPRRLLEWKGSHLTVRYSPDNRFVATSTQDNALHIWRMATGKDMQMQGYPTKVKQIAWSADSRFLYSSAAEHFIAWSFAGKGPEGKPPMEYGEDGAGLITAIAAHPSAEFVVAGYDTGEVQLGDGKTRAVATIRLAGDSPVTHVAWVPDGWHIAVAGESGNVDVVDLRR